MWERPRPYVLTEAEKALIHECRANGYSWESVAERLGLCSSVVKRMVRVSMPELLPRVNATVVRVQQNAAAIREWRREGKSWDSIAELIHVSSDALYHCRNKEQLILEDKE